MSLWQDLVSSAVKHPIFFTVMAIIFGVFAFIFWKAIIAFVFLVLTIFVAMLAIIGIRKTEAPISKTMRAILMIIVPIFLIISLIGVYNLFGILYEPDTETEPYVFDPLGYGQYRMKGGFSQDSTGNPDELLDNDKYVMSWRPNKVGEKIMVKVHFHQPIALAWIVTTSYYEWRVYLDDNPQVDENGDWINPDIYSTADHNDDRIYWDLHGGVNPGIISIKSGIWDYPWEELDQSEIFHIVGNYGGWYLRVEVIWHVEGWYSVIPYKGTLKIHDEAYLLDGSGEVIIQPSNDGDYVFEEGETVRFKVRTGASGPSVGNYSAGWQLRLYKPNGIMYGDTNGDGIVDEDVYIYDEDGNPYRLPADIPDFLENKVFYWTVPQGAWSPTGSNQWYIKLYNQLIKQDDKYFFTIDVAEKRPEMVKIEVSNQYPKTGETVTVNLEGKPNQYTQSPIDRFQVSVYYGYPHQITRYIMQDAIFEATNNMASFVFVADSVGHITVEARCIDEDNRISSALYSGLDASGEPPPLQTVGPGQVFVYYLSADIDKGLLGMKPDTIQCKFVDSTSKTVYVSEHKPKVVQDKGSTWHVEDTITFQVPAFPKTGDWKVFIKVRDKLLWTIYGDLYYEVVGFKVVEGSIFQNMFAPVYFHLDLWVKDWWIKIPAFWAIITILALIIIAWAVMRFYFHKSLIGEIRRKARR